jgi:hypothetical protein
MGHRSVLHTVLYPVPVEVFLLTGHQRPPIPPQILQRQACVVYKTVMQCMSSPACAVPGLQRLYFIDFSLNLAYACADYTCTTNHLALH